MDERLRAVARTAPGFLPEPEGEALYAAGLAAGRRAPLLEIGSYCGKSAVYLGAAARESGTVLFSIDHHRGSEEHQPGQQYHDPRHFDAALNRVDTLPAFRRTIAAADLEDVVIGVVGDSKRVARNWTQRLGLVFIDGGHSDEAATSDFAGWAPKLVPGGLLAIHDVFPDPEAGGQAPFRVYRQALDSGSFEEISVEGSLRVLRALS